MNAHCPDCQHQFPRAHRGNLLGGFWTPRVAACPNCGTHLQWPLLFWRMQILGGAAFLPALFRQLPGDIRLTFVGTSLILIFIAIYNLKLRKTDQGLSDS